MSLKTLIFFGLLAVALGFTLPEEQVDSVAVSEWENPEVIPLTDDVLLVRKARSPQRLDARFVDRGRDGSTANFEYTHPINKNWEAYASGSRDFKFQDTRAEAGLRFKF